MYLQNTVGIGETMMIGGYFFFIEWIILEIDPTLYIWEANLCDDVVLGFIREILLSAHHLVKHALGRRIEKALMTMSCELVYIASTAYHCIASNAMPCERFSDKWCVHVGHIMAKFLLTHAIPARATDRPGK